MYDNHNGLMADVAQRVRGGQIWWVAGEIPAEKVLAVVSKMARLHGVMSTKQQRHRRKQVGQPACSLVVWPVLRDPSGSVTRFRFLLLATEHLVGERMYDARERRVRVDFYAEGDNRVELVLNHRPGPAGRFNVTWQLDRRTDDAMRRRLTEAAACDPSSMARILDHYRGYPMWSGVRSQLMRALREVRAVVSRSQHPAVQRYRREVHAGQRPDVLGRPLPAITRFPTRYADPPVTLGGYLDTQRQLRRARERDQLRRARAEHQPDPPVSL